MYIKFINLIILEIYMFKNPIKTKSWNKLYHHFISIKKKKIIDLFKEDIDRFNNFSINFNNEILVDFSKNNIIKSTLNLFVNLLNEIGFNDYISSMLYGRKINFTENKPVLHFLLRDVKNVFLKYNSDYIDIKKDIDTNLNKIKIFTEKILNGEWLGFTGKKIINIVNVGIGGSDLGPRMIINALSLYKHSNINIYFVSNVDSNDVIKILNKLTPENTLFIICSKTFTTLETLNNANILRDWVLNYYNNKIKSLNNHFILVSSNFSESIKFGVNFNNIFIVHDWVGGRYSYCSAFGISISLSIGFDNFMKLLKGAHDMDIHFFNSRYLNNIPIILAMISIWYNNFFKFNNEAILVYNENLFYFPMYLQQLIMESNGKYIDNNGLFINKYNTSSVIWGGVGTTSQHSFFQLLHQGTCIVPCDFIGEIININSINNSHFKLMSNFFSQTESLAFGEKIFKVNNLNKFSKFKGNRPTNTILVRKFNPYNLGLLISLYEHKTFTQGIILNICSFDQWGVELGKKLSNLLLPYLGKKKKIKQSDFKNNINLNYSTLNLINFFNKYNKKK